MSGDVLPFDGLPPRPADRLLPGAGLALVVHIGLVGALALGVDWRRHSDVVHSAELWSALPQVAAPRAPEPAPAPPPPPPPPPPAPAPAPAPPPPARSEVQIAIEKEKQAQAEREARLKREREAEARRAREAEQAALRQQRELQRKRAEELARQAEEARRQAEEARRQAELDKQRKENLERMLAQAGGTGRADSTGRDARDAAPSNQYAGRLIAHILANLVMPDIDRLPKSLEAVVQVRATASGTVLSRRLVKSSGNDAWDDAVLRAIDRAGTLPRDTDGRVPTSIEITFRPPQ